MDISTIWLVILNKYLLKILIYNIKPKLEQTYMATEKSIAEVILISFWLLKRRREYTRAY